MATEKTRKKQNKVKKAAAKRKAAMKKPAKKKLAAKKKAAPRKKLAKKKFVVKKTAVKTRAVGKKTTGGKTAGASRQRVQGKGQSSNIESFAPEEVRTRSGGQSGDLLGLSNTASADSESVDELIEEGNAFEAEVVAGVEAADTGDEVRTQEVPEDDVPGQYLDKE